MMRDAPVASTSRAIALSLRPEARAFCRRFRPRRAVGIFAAHVARWATALLTAFVLTAPVSPTYAHAAQCPDGARVDRVEGSSVVLVFGNSGVRVISAQLFAPTRLVTEGDVVRAARHDRRHPCVSHAPRREDIRAIELRQHALQGLHRSDSRVRLTPPGVGGSIPRPFSDPEDDR